MHSTLLALAPRAARCCQFWAGCSSNTIKIMRAINPADEIRFAEANVVIASNLSSGSSVGTWRACGVYRVACGGYLDSWYGCKVRLCDNNFRLIMMRVMASRVSVAITLHVFHGLTVGSKPNKWRHPTAGRWQKLNHNLLPWQEYTLI